MDVETGNHRSVFLARPVHLKQLGHQLAQSLVTGVAAIERGDRQSVAQDPRADRVPLGMVGIEQALRRCPVDNPGQFPRRVTRVS